MKELSLKDFNVVIGGAANSQVATIANEAPHSYKNKALTIVKRTLLKTALTLGGLVVIGSLFIIYDKGE